MLSCPVICFSTTFASGITIGLGISFGGLTSPILGYIADTYGIAYTMYTITAVAFVAALLAFLVPDIDKIRADRKARLEKTEAPAER